MSDLDTVVVHNGRCGADYAGGGIRPLQWRTERNSKAW